MKLVDKTYNYRIKEKLEDGKAVGYTMIVSTSKREPYHGVVEVS